MLDASFCDNFEWFQIASKLPTKSSFPRMSSYILSLSGCILSFIHPVSSQWQLLDSKGPSPRIGHSIITYNNGTGHDILILFGGRSQRFETCKYNDNWDWNICGDHVHAKLVDTTIVPSHSMPEFPECTTNCSENGWCHYDETISDSYCICYDDYRGPNCQFKEFQEYEYDVWYLDLSDLQWTQYEFCFISKTKIS